MTKGFSRYVRALSPFARGVAARIAYKTAADVAGRVATLIVVVAAARSLPREDFGVLALALTTGWLVGVAADAGVPMHLARVAARLGPAGSRPTLAVVLRLRLALAGAAWAVGSALGWMWAPDGAAAAFAVVVLAQLAAAMIETLGHVFRGLGRAEIEAHVQSAQRTGAAAAGLAVLWAAPSLTALSLALAVPAVFGAVAMGRMAWTATAPAASPPARSDGAADGSVDPPGDVAGTPSRTGDAPERPSVGALARAAAPLGIGALLSALYFRIDLYFLEHWHGLEAVAGYNAAFRIVQALRMVPGAVLAVVFPFMCRTHSFHVLRATGTALALAGVLAAVLPGAAPAFVMAHMYGAAYVDASPALGRLALAVPLFFINYALTHQVIGWDGQRAYAGIAALALGVNVAANAWLVPGRGMEGAATAVLLTELAVTTGCAWALARGPRDAS